MIKYRYGTLRYLYTFCLIEVVLPIIDAQNCSVTVGGPKPNSPCIFPFVFAGKTHWSCTDLKDPGKYWCSTKVNKEGEHIGGASFWGYCDKSCHGSSVEDQESNANGIGNILD